MILDLIELQTLAANGTILHPITPLQLYPTWSETEQQYVITDEELRLYVVAPTREKLIHELVAEIISTWHGYVSPGNQTASPALTAQILKRKYSAKFREHTTKGQAA